MPAPSVCLTRSGLGINFLGIRGIAEAGFQEAGSEFTIS